MNKDENKISQRKSPRLAEFDYSLIGYYFVTICTKDRQNHFGLVRNGKVVLSPAGMIAQNKWQSIPKYYPNVKLDEYVIMPNHIHGIIFIRDEITTKVVGTEHRSVHRKGNLFAKTRAEQCSAPTKNHYGLLSKIIKSFKESVTKEINKEYGLNNFGWQRSFYDHVVRNEKDLIRVRQYIKNNPLKWFLDEYYNEQA